MGSGPEPFPPVAGTRLLLVDDNPKLCRMVKEYLEPLGYQVSLAHTGPDGLDKALRGNFQVVILDVGTRAYVSFISPTQINILTPPGPISGSVAVQVTVNRTASTPFSVNAQVDDPAFFAWGNYVAATHADNTPVGPGSLFPGQSTAVKPGETITLWGNGFGATSTPINTGAPAQSGTLTPMPVVLIGGQQAPVNFGGLVADGLYQINVTVPAGTRSGDQTISTSHNGASTQTGLLINVSN